jgi:pyridoxine 5-phosphate synthase
MKRLGVNIDHVATVRNARGTRMPDPVEAAFAAINGGADQITVHLREDRRHITDRDVRILKDILPIPLNLEMALTQEMLDIALQTKPQMVTLVPERREERTTEGGLNLKHNVSLLKKAIETLSTSGVHVSLFVEPEVEVLHACKLLQVPMVELHTGTYSEKELGSSAQHLELDRIALAVGTCSQLDLISHVGHGLNYANTRAVALLKGVVDLNIGHSIVARSLFVGLEKAVREMKDIVEKSVNHHEFA